MDTKELIEILQKDIEDKNSVRQVISTTLKYLEYVEACEYKVGRPKFSILVKKLFDGLKVNYGKLRFSSSENKLIKISNSLDFAFKSYFRCTQVKISYTSLPKLTTLLIIVVPLGLSINVSISALIFSISLITFLVFSCIFLFPLISKLCELKCISLTNKLEEELLSLIAKTGIFQGWSSSFYNLYIPEKADSVSAETLIQEAIQIIQDDFSLTPEARQKIIAQLETALSSLRKGDLKDFFGTIKETIIILGALGSIAGGYYAAVTQAESKINDAVDILEKTSINQNFKTLGYKPSCFTDANLLESKDLETLPPSIEEAQTKVLQEARLETSTEENSIDLASQGIDKAQAEILRHNLEAFAEDWDSPEMSIYDDYDANKANH